MPTAKKVETIAELTDLLRRSQLAILAEYRGTSVAQLSDLRKKLREAGAELHVAKNTLTRIAAQQVGKGNMVPALEGPMAIAFAMGDPAAAAKVMTEHLRISRTPMKIKAGLIENRLLGAAEVEALATLPPREVLLARVLGGMQAPMAGLVTVLNANLRGLMVVLQQRAEQLGGGESPAGAVA
ncbi:MAG: 50S ribosomal protein L10 [Chloroflexota bacterium]|nr:MAG: 50S ribosomal protein L10 [Chloroflexota bacterium]